MIGIRSGITSARLAYDMPENIQLKCNFGTAEAIGRQYLYRDILLCPAVPSATRPPRRERRTNRTSRAIEHAQNPNLLTTL